MQKFALNEFSTQRRENLLAYDVYEYNFDETAIETFKIVGLSLARPPEQRAHIPIANFVGSTAQRAWSALTHIANMYSAGHDLNVLRSFFPRAVEYWECYADYSKQYNESPEGSRNPVGHITLNGTDYVRALQLVCFAILLGWDSLLHRIAEIIDYQNDKDGLLEHLLAPYVSGRPTPPKECLRHLPYFKTLKIFTANESERAELVADYLQDWYHSSRREVYFDSHKRSEAFTGYWCWEAAAITVALGIDDASYRTAQFYPGDMVDFARQAKLAYAPLGLPAIAEGELRAKAGDACPKGGTWQALDIEQKYQTIELDQTMPNLASAYGLTVWRYIEGN